MINKTDALAFLRRHLWVIALLAVLVAAATLYFARVPDHPPGFYIDESSICYNAYTISQTGRDEYGNEWPLFFRAFSDYKNPVYIYLLAGLFRFTGPSIFVARLLCAVLGNAAAGTVVKSGTLRADARSHVYLSATPPHRALRQVFHYYLHYAAKYSRQRRLGVRQALFRQLQSLATVSEGRPKCISDHPSLWRGTITRGDRAAQRCGFASGVSLSLSGRVVAICGLRCGRLRGPGITYQRVCSHVTARSPGSVFHFADYFRPRGADKQTAPQNSFTSCSINSWAGRSLSLGVSS